MTLAQRGPGYRTHRRNFTGQSEFSGEVRGNTLPQNPLPERAAATALTAGQKARLIKTTGFENITAPQDLSRAFNGLLSYPYSQVDLEDYREAGQIGSS